MATEEGIAIKPVPDDAGDVQIDLRQLESLRVKLVNAPKILNKTAGRDTCSIFKVPKSLMVDVNHYHPHIVSIGPFHHGKPHLQMIQEHKHTYLAQLLDHTQITLRDLFNIVSPLETAARNSYSKEIHLDSHNFVEIMVVDGCFILQLLMKVFFATTAKGWSAPAACRFEPDDPLVTESWIIPFLRGDLLRLENQLPFFVLRRLFDQTGLSKMTEGRELTDLCFTFFSYHEAVKRPEIVRKGMRDIEEKHPHHHLLDLLRSSFTLPLTDDVMKKRFSTTTTSENTTTTTYHVIKCVSKLRRAGIKIRPRKREPKPTTFLDVKFLKCRGVIEMPVVLVDDFMTSFLANCVAYEISRKNCRDRHFTTYAALLNGLVNTAEEVDYLSDRNIINHYLVSDEEVAKFMNSLAKELPIDISECYLRDLFWGVNQYCDNKCYEMWGSFKVTYFDTPWSFLASMAAFLLLIFTTLQTVYTMVSYHHHGGS